MNARGLLVLSAVALAACGGTDEAAVEGAETTTADAGATVAPAPAADTTMAMPGATTPATGGTQTVPMTAVGASGVTGQVQVMAHGAAQTMVMVTLNAQGNSTHPGHIHQGTCDAPGTVVVPLQDVTLANGTGNSSTTLDIPTSTVANGQHIVQYHASSGDNPGAPVVCAAIPAGQAM